jgi:hypothetical protein
MTRTTGRPGTSMMSIPRQEVGTRDLLEGPRVPPETDRREIRERVDAGVAELGRLARGGLGVVELVTLEQR